MMNSMITSASINRFKMLKMSHKAKLTKYRPPEILSYQLDWVIWERVEPLMTANEEELKDDTLKS